MKTIFVIFFAALILGASFRGPALPFLGSAGIAGFLAAAAQALSVVELLYPIVIIGGFWSILNNAAWPLGALVLGASSFAAKFLPGRFLYLSFWLDKLVKGVAAAAIWAVAFMGMVFYGSGKIDLKDMGTQTVVFFIYFAVFTVVFRSGLKWYEQIFHKT